MSARISPEMLRAIELIKAGATRSSAARQTGLRTTSITRSRLYKEWAATQEAGMALEINQDKEKK